MLNIYMAKLSDVTDPVTRLELTAMTKTKLHADDNVKRIAGDDNQFGCGTASIHCFTLVKVG